MSVGGEVALAREKIVNDTSWADANLTVPKNEKIHTVDLAASNRW
jgi:hypothetical protein